MRVVVAVPKDSSLRNLNRLRASHLIAFGGVRSIERKLYLFSAYYSHFYHRNIALMESRFQYRFLLFILCRRAGCLMRYFVCNIGGDSHF